MHSWPKVIVRAFAIANIVMGLFGFSLTLDEVVRATTHLYALSHWPYEIEAFYVTSTVNLACVLVLILTGPLLWRLEKRGLFLSNALFGFELFFLLVLPAMEMMLFMTLGQRVAALSDSIAAVAGIGNMGLGIQIVTGYPLISLLALNLAYRRLKGSQR